LPIEARLETACSVVFTLGVSGVAGGGSSKGERATR
jgi:hypothetical protein